MLILNIMIIYFFYFKNYNNKTIYFVVNIYDFFTAWRAVLIVVF